MHRALLAGVAAFAAAILYFVLSVIIRRSRSSSRARKLHCQPAPRLRSPDPFGMTLILDILKADREKRLPDYLCEVQQQISQEQGRSVSTYAITRPGFKTDYFTSDPRNIQAVLANQFKDYGIGAARSGNFEPMLGHGIFASDGAAWEHSRALLRPQFSREQISDLDLEERHVQNMMRVLDLQMDRSSGWTNTVDLQPLFFKLTLDSATEFLFGESADSQLDGLPGLRPTKHSDIDFAFVFDRGQMHLAKSGRFADFWWMGHTKDFKNMCKQVHEYIDPFVQLAIKQETASEEKKRTGVGFEEKEEAGGGGKYVFLQALAKETRDPYELRSQLLHILLAGRDTTASLLGWLWLLISQPENAAMFARLRADVLQDFGTYHHPKQITSRTLKACTYLQWCLNEALRLFPVVPFNSRRAFVPTTLPRGGGPDGNSPICIEKDQEIMYSVHVMHHRKELWGEDADDFKPERWDGHKPGWEYLPFNGGPRICIGQQFALTEAGYVTVRLIQRFCELEGPPMYPVKHGLTLTNCPAEGVKVKLRLAGN